MKVRDNINTKYGNRFWYPNLEDIKDVEDGGLNLSNKPRPWYTFKRTYENGTTEVISGREAFNDPQLYRPIQLKNYIEKYYIEPFASRHKKSPFMYYKTDQRDYSGPNSEFILNPHQKFCAQFLNYQTDFPGLLVFHKIGSGKTPTATAIAASFQQKYIMSGNMMNIKGRSIDVNNVSYNCPITFVVPNNLINSYLDELSGRERSGKGSTSTCIIYAEDDKQKLKNLNDYENYRQYYVGKTEMRNGKLVYTSNDLAGLVNIDSKITEIENNIKNINVYNEKDGMLLLQQYKKELDILYKQRKNKERDINKGINDIYFIVSIDTFMSRLYDNDEYGNIIPSTYLTKKKEMDPIKSSNGRDPLHPYCFNSKNSIIVIDEIQNTGKDRGKKYDGLKNALFNYARSLQSGNYTLKVVLLTATPIFNDPSEIADILNLLRPRLTFPKEILYQGNNYTFNDLFITEDEKMKNPLLWKYMTSGYISYFSGGNPENYPYRRNLVMLHKMGAEQYTQYRKDLLAELVNKKEKNKPLVHGIFLNKDDKSGMHKKSMGTCTSASLKGLRYRDTDTEQVSGGSYGEDEDVEYEMDSEGNIVEKKKTMEYTSTNRETAMLKNSLKHFGDFSPKLKWIADHIAKESEGPIFVYSGEIEKGILPLALYLETIGFEMITNEDSAKEVQKYNRNYKKLKFGVWSPTAFRYFRSRFQINRELNDYNNILKKLFNDPLNSDGSVCKIIIGNITEGVSFKRVSEVHICGPWWNESKTEQIIGRGIRFKSHEDLPENKRFVNVYYHCTVLPEYPRRDQNLQNEIGRISKYEAEKFSVQSIDQFIYNRSKLKNKTNLEFEQRTKESAIDNILNEEGNLVRLEELKYFYTPDLPINFSMEKQESWYYNRSTDEYYIISNNENDGPKLYKINVEDINWPPKTYHRTDKILKEPIRVKYDSFGNKMVFIVVKEKIDSFMEDTKTNNKNFYELKDYAIKHGEEKIAWNIIEDYNRREHMITSMFKYYNIYSNISLLNFKTLLLNILYKEAYPIPSVFDKDEIINKDKHHLIDKLKTEHKFMRELDFKKININNFYNMTYKKVRDIVTKINKEIDRKEKLRKR